MALFQFVNGDIARSAEVNANFEYIMDIIGQLSTPGSIEGQGQFVLGPRATALFTAKQDTGPDAQAFAQYSWNTRFQLVSGAWKFDRVVSNNPASAIRVGKNGLEFLTTSATSGDLNSQMTKVFGVRATAAADYMFVKNDLHIQGVDATADEVQDYRLTPVFLSTPIVVYNGWVGAGSTVLNAHTLGVPSHALGVILYTHLTPSASSGAGMHFYPKRANAVTDVDRARGFVIAGYSGNTATGRVGGQGMVPLGSGGNKGQFVVERTAAFELAKVYITGYLT
jgi:hypothetical protein